VDVFILALSGCLTNNLICNHWLYLDRRRIKRSDMKIQFYSSFQALALNRSCGPLEQITYMNWVAEGVLNRNQVKHSTNILWAAFISTDHKSAIRLEIKSLVSFALLGSAFVKAAGKMFVWVKFTTSQKFYWDILDTTISKARNQSYQN